MGAISQPQDPEGEVGVLGEYPNYRQRSSEGSPNHTVPHSTRGSAMKTPNRGYNQGHGYWVGLGGFCISGRGPHREENEQDKPKTSEFPLLVQ